MRAQICLAIISICCLGACSAGGVYPGGSADPIRQPANYTTKCVLCGIVMNEIEGLLAENKTEKAIMESITKNVCEHTAKEIRPDCDDIVSKVPILINQTESRNSVSVVCVDNGYCEAPIANGPDLQHVPTYVIDLDALPTDRWKAVCSNKQFAVDLQEVIGGFESFFGDTARELNSLGKLVNALYIPVEYALEIQGCAAAAKVDVGWLTIFNMMYEISEACTSIVSQAPNGTILHARNMDFGDGFSLTNHFKNSTFTAEFRKLGKVQFYSSSIAGLVGIVSGMKPKAFSFTVNARVSGNHNILQFVKRFIEDVQKKNATLVSFLGRDTLNIAKDYDAAITKLSNTPIIVNSYFILGGISAGEGVVITRNPENTTDIWRLNTTAGRWFEVETNYDHWIKAPWFDDRIDYANEGMRALGQNVTLDQMLTKVLSKKPVLNLQTIYSVITSAATGAYATYERNCQYPCAE